MQLEKKREILARTRRVVVKLGSSLVASPDGVQTERVGELVAQIARARQDGLDVVVVTSGARAAGLRRLGLNAMPVSIPEQQAAAAIGQIRLMALYERFFGDHGKQIGQVLLTASDAADRTRYLNARQTLKHLLSHGVIPVVNENDSVAVEELKFGDNDRLSALVAGLVDADLLILLTDVDGLYAGDPRTGSPPLIDLVEDVDELLAKGIAGNAGALGTGGMHSKLTAARSAKHRGIPTIIANGTRPGVLRDILRPDVALGTLVCASQAPISTRQHWIAYGMPCRGELVLDPGAIRAVTERGSSLLPAGVREVRGRFLAGECVSLLEHTGREFARGLVNYEADACRTIIGKPSTSIPEALGYHVADEMIHRDNLVLLANTAPGSTPPAT